MAMTIDRSGGDGAPPFITPERLCLDETKQRIVPCDSAEARFLLAGEGGTISAEDVKRFGLTTPASASATVGGTKRRSATKMQRLQADK